MRHPRLVLPLLALLAACADPAGVDPSNVLLATDRESYRTGETVRVTLSNRSGSTIGLNACLVDGERRSGDAWQRISPLRLCTGDFDRVAPGGTASFQEPMTREWEPGLYRVGVRVAHLDGGGRVEVFTDPFRIEP